jgi:hypothetical protein
MNEIKEPEKEIKEENNLPPGFTPVIEEDQKKDECIFEVTKSKNYEKIFPSLIQKIDQKLYQNKSSEDYPYFNKNNKIKFLPRLDSKSEILSNNQLKELHLYFPYFLQYSSLSKIFSLSQDGTALKTLYKKCEGIKNSILVIKDNEKNIFGAFASDILDPSATFTGSVDSFLFTFYKEEKIHVYKATHINDNFMYCDFEKICFGNSGDNFSLALTNSLLDGTTTTTDTYKNKPLNGGNEFTVVNVEILGFKEN